MPWSKHWTFLPAMSLRNLKLQRALHFHKNNFHHSKKSLPCRSHQKQAKPFKIMFSSKTIAENLMEHEASASGSVVPAPQKEINGPRVVATQSFSSPAVRLAWAAPNVTKYLWTLVTATGAPVDYGPGLNLSLHVNVVRPRDGRAPAGKIMEDVCN